MQKKLENYFILVACTPTASKSCIHRRQFLWLAENLPKVKIFWVVSALGLNENTHRSSIVNRSTKQLTLEMNLIEKLLRKSPRKINGGMDKRLRANLREYLIKPAKLFSCCLADDWCKYFHRLLLWSCFLCFFFFLFQNWRSKHRKITLKNKAAQSNLLQKLN